MLMSAFSTQVFSKGRNALQNIRAVRGCRLDLPPARARGGLLRTGTSTGTQGLAAGPVQYKEQGTYLHTLLLSCPCLL